jgi:hypothetical protein
MKVESADPSSPSAVDNTGRLYQKANHPRALPKPHSHHDGVMSLGLQALNLNASALANTDNFGDSAVGGSDSLNSTWSFGNSTDKAFKKAMPDGDYGFVNIFLLFYNLYFTFEKEFFS